MFKEVFANFESQKIIQIPSISLPLENDNKVQQDLFTNNFKILWNGKIYLN